MDMIKPSRRTVLLSAAAGAGSLGLPWWARAGSPAKKLVVQVFKEKGITTAVNDALAAASSAAAATRPPPR